MDRNKHRNSKRVTAVNVALLAEGVDRNGRGEPLEAHQAVSPSSRRAWIEILATEGAAAVGMSPSSRRAWIEIPLCAIHGRHCYVALLAEGVDRNVEVEDTAEDAQVALLAEGVDRNVQGLL